MRKIYMITFKYSSKVHFLFSNRLSYVLQIQIEHQIWQLKNMKYVGINSFAIHREMTQFATF